MDNISNGLCQYGQVIELELNRDPLFPDSSNSQGFAIIEPLPNVAENINFIPRVAHFVREGLASPSFRIITEKAPSACDLCKHIGHEMNACPEQLLKLLKKQSEDTTDQGIDYFYNDYGSTMGDEVDGDKFLDASETASQVPEDSSVEVSQEFTNTTESYEWGEFASYRVVKPTTKEERKEAHKKVQKNSTSEKHLRILPVTLKIFNYQLQKPIIFHYLITLT